VIPAEEERHLVSGPRPGENPGGARLVSVAASCHGDADQVLSRCREVMLSMLADAGPPWPSTTKWLESLPPWFVARCAPQRTRQEAQQWLDRWRTLPAEERSSVADEVNWSVSDWLFWLEPSERQWYWWDAVVQNSDRLWLVVEIEGWPVALGALRWLLRASGAVAVTQDIDYESKN
jgi:hypothetical protein